MANEKMAALKSAISQINTRFGKGSIMKLGEKSVRTEEDIIPTGSLSLDLALGVGGIPRGRVVEIYGKESSGKTTLSLNVIAQAQIKEGVAAFIDAEHALDPTFASRLGVRVEELLISQPNCGEEALEIADTLVRSGAVDVIVIDSVAALVPRAELEGNMGDVHVGLQARLMSQALRKLTAVCAKSKTAIIFINQIREKVGVMFGNPEVTSGGRALKFYSSIRIEVRKSNDIKEADRVIGNRVKVKVVKNKVAPPFTTAEFDLFYASGICQEAEMVDLSVERNIITKSGSWYSYGETRLGQGRDAALKYLMENPKAFEEIKAKLHKIFTEGNIMTIAPVAPAEEKPAEVSKTEKKTSSS